MHSTNYIISKIDKYLRELAEKTKASHISAFLIDGYVNICDYTDLKNKKFNYTKEIKNEKH